jgi:hypothetical protein
MRPSATPRKAMFVGAVTSVVVGVADGNAPL